jgi:hypothetical protein
MKKLVAPFLAVILTAVASPVLVWHGCGLSSWPLEWSLALLLTLGAFAAAHRCEKKWLKISVVIAAPLLSLGATSAYHNWLHSESFPDSLLDRSGKEWRERTRQDQEPIQPPETTRGR